jgi:predicted transcriptional regulator
MLSDQKSLVETKKENHRRNDLTVERRNRGLSIKEVARIIGASERTLEGYERGRYMPSLVMALKLQILYRGQIASFYQSLHARLTAQIRDVELLVIRDRGNA